MTIPAFGCLLTVLTQGMHATQITMSKIQRTLFNFQDSLVN